MDSYASASGNGADANRGPLAQLVETNLPLVDEVLAELSETLPAELDRDELASAGRVGLVEASRTYPGDNGSPPFTEWARLRVRGSVLDAVRDARWAPRAVQARAAALRAARSGLTDELGRPPTTEEWAVAAGTLAADLRAGDGDGVRAGLLRRTEPLAATVQSGTDASLVTLLLSPATGAEQRSVDYAMRLALGNALARMTAQQRAVIYGACLEGRSNAALAGVLGVTEDEIEEVLAETLAYLNDLLRDEWLRLHGFATGNGGDQRAADYAEAMRRYRQWYGDRRPQLA